MLGYDDFHAHWQLRRFIDDRYGNQKGDLRGAVGFREAGENRLKYNEFGKIRFGEGPILEANRSYLWDFRQSDIAVSFEDGGPFHRFTPEGKVAGTDHPCGDDDYRVAYDFTAWPDWTATWTVTGPRKDYTSVSHYSEYNKREQSKGPPELKPLQMFVVKPLPD